MIPFWEHLDCQGAWGRRVRRESTGAQTLEQVDRGAIGTFHPDRATRSLCELERCRDERLARSRIKHPVKIVDGAKNLPADRSGKRNLRHLPLLFRNAVRRN